MKVVSVNSKGIVKIPKEILDILGISSKGNIVFRKLDKHIIIENLEYMETRLSKLDKENNK